MMTNHKRNAAALFLVLASVLSLGWGDTEEEIRTAADAVQTVRADFVQEKHMKILVRPLVSTGRFVYAAPGSLRWQYTSPIQSLLLMHDGNTARYTFQQGRWAAEAGFDLQAMQVVVEQIAGWLSGRFDQDGLFSARLTPGRRIVLVPKAEGFARFIERIELQLSQKPGVLSSVVLVEGPEAYTRIRFSDVQVNGPIEPSDFTVPQ
jgi:outer membrane lipoprotein-sorting protein